MRSIVVALLALSACASDAEPVIAARESPCSLSRFEGSRFTVCDPGPGKIRMVAGHRRFTELNIDPAELSFAMNGGMFDDAGAPIGLMVIDGREIHAINRKRGFGNFHLLPNGVFAVRNDGRTEVVSADAYAPAPDIAFATQSGPMLLIDGALHPGIDPDGRSHFIRNAVGIAPDGRARFVISDDAVSFGRLARFMRDELGMKNALYLDGSVSSLWNPAGNRMDNFTDLGPIIVVARPASGSTPRP